jgi:hypothetical protein
MCFRFFASPSIVEVHLLPVSCRPRSSSSLSYLVTPSESSLRLAWQLCKDPRSRERCDSYQSIFGVSHSTILRKSFGDQFFGADESVWQFNDMMAKGLLADDWASTCANEARRNKSNGKRMQIQDCASLIQNWQKDVDPGLRISYPELVTCHCHRYVILKQDITWQVFE